MRVLVTGSNGFVGRHAVHELAGNGHEVVAMTEAGQPAPEDAAAHITANILDGDTLAASIEEHQPEACLHLAGIAFVPVGWSDPQTVFRVNVIGTVNLLEAFRAHRPDAPFLSVTSSLIYGNHERPHRLTESEPHAPANIYAVSKSAQDGMTLLYAKRYGMPAMTARPCNHIGPGQSDQFVVSAFARQVIAIANKEADPVMRVGNLASEHGFTDVRDTVRAYRLLIESGKPGNAYNVASENLVTIQSLLDSLCGIAGVNPDIEVDQDLYRPTDSQPLFDCSRVFDDTGWKPEIAIETTLRDVLQDFRDR